MTWRGLALDRSLAIRMFHRAEVRRKSARTKPIFDARIPRKYLPGKAFHHETRPAEQTQFCGVALPFADETQRVGMAGEGDFSWRWRGMIRDGENGGVVLIACAMGEGLPLLDEVG